MTISAKMAEIMYQDYLEGRKMYHKDIAFAADDHISNMADEHMERMCGDEERGEVKKAQDGLFDVYVDDEMIFGGFETEAMPLSELERYIGDVNDEQT